MSNTYSAGVATAYGAAVRGGYTGTYAEWCAAMADFGDKSQQAIVAAEQAAQSAADAANSATDAADSASSAETFKGNAEDSAATAHNSEANAADSASAAAQSATGAADSASAAAGSATNAAASAAAAQAVKDSIPADYIALSDDVSVLKSAFVDINAALSVEPSIPDVRIFLSSTRIKTKPVYVRKGSVFDLSGAAGVMVYINGYSSESKAKASYALENSTTNGDLVYSYPYQVYTEITIKADGWYMLVFKKSDDSTFADDTLKNNIHIYTEIQYAVRRNRDLSLFGHYDLNHYANGSFGAAGQLSFGTTTRVRLSDFYILPKGTVIEIDGGSNRYAVGLWKNSLSSQNIIRNDNAFKPGSETIVLEYNCYIMVVFAKTTAADNISPSDIDGHIRIMSFAEVSEDNLISARIVPIETDVAAIENVINELSGSKLSPDALLVRKNLPTYYTSTSYTINGYDIDYLEKKIKSIPYGKHFIVRTDTHVPDNEKKSTVLMDYIRKRMNIKTVIDLGDWINRGTTKYLGWTECADYVYESQAAFGTDFLVAIGNHDLNSANVSAADQSTYVIPYKDAQSLFQGHLGDTVVYPDFPTEVEEMATGDDLDSLKALYKMFHYRDDHDNKIRYVVLYSGADGTITNTYFGVVGNEVLAIQFDWLADTLMSTPSGYDVIVLVHQMSGSYHYIQPIQQACMKICAHFKSKSTYTLNYTGDCTIYAQGNHVYDFTNAPTSGKVFCCAGHIHYDQTLYVSKSTYGILSGTVDNTSGVIPVITTLTDSAGMHEYERNSTVYTEEGETFYEMTPETVTEQAIDVYTITDAGITITRIGAGIDRSLSFA